LQQLEVSCFTIIPDLSSHSIFCLCVTELQPCAGRIAANFTQALLHLDELTLPHHALLAAHRTLIFVMSFNINMFFYRSQTGLIFGYDIGGSGGTFTMHGFRRQMVSAVVSHVLASASRAYSRLHLCSSSASTCFDR
jgi:hypothetical protein